MNKKYFHGCVCQIEFEFELRSKKMIYILIVWYCNMYFFSYLKNQQQ